MVVLQHSSTCRHCDAARGISGVYIIGSVRCLYLIIINHTVAILRISNANSRHVAAYLNIEDHGTDFAFTQFSTISAQAVKNSEIYLE